MAFLLSLPAPWPARGWKAKIRDQERLEPPHVTLIRGRRCWRIGLRSGEFLDEDPSPADVPKALVAVVKQRWGERRRAWDDMYPENPVQTEEAGDE